MKKDFNSFMKELHINPEIIKFLENREVPSFNLYWDNCTNYIDFNSKKLFIPFMMEILNNVSQQTILDKLTSKHYIIEKILHINELQERESLSDIDCIQMIMQIPSLRDRKKHYFYEYILKQINDFPKSIALRRGNYSCLFLLVIYEKEGDFDKLTNSVKIFNTIVACSCILDDFYDIEDDLDNDEMNFLKDKGYESNKLKSIDLAKKHFNQLLNQIDTKSPHIDFFLRKLCDKAYLDLFKNLLIDEK